MNEILNYAVYKLELDEIENSDDWFDANGQDAIEFCEGAGLNSNSDYFYFCLRVEVAVSAGEGEYVEIGY